MRTKHIARENGPPSLSLSLLFSLSLSCSFSLSLSLSPSLSLAQTHTHTSYILTHIMHTHTHFLTNAVRKIVFHESRLCLGPLWEQAAVGFHGTNLISGAKKWIPAKAIGKVRQSRRQEASKARTLGDPSI